MKHLIQQQKLPAILVALTLGITSTVALADKPDWAGGKKNKSHDAQEERSGNTSPGFRDEDRKTIGEYYHKQVAKGKCPPGLAKKNNGCQPPGQAKKWQKGQPLAPDIQIVELPKELRIRLPAPPPQHRYVRIAGDILLIAAGTRMVVDAVEDILK